ncbi:MAG: hypothetical protein Q8R00_04085 [Candidatus Nanoarchaeia archaeon]|nr:hypothetical protein [Candidatus Nanoarchaeia archaeon]
MRKILLISLLILIISLAGCQFKRDVSVESLGAYIGGSTGLKFSFLENAPPEAVYDENQDEFDIAIMLENEGEYDIPSNKIISSLSGIRAEDFNVNNLNRVLSTSLDGKTISGGVAVRGSQDELIYEGAKYKHDLKADFSAKIIAHVCYEYKTDAITSLCLKRDVLRRGDAADTCSLENDALKLDVSSGPIQVSNTQQVPRSKNEIKLTFEVSNSGSGEVYDPSAFKNTCFGQEDQIDKVKVKVTSPADGLNIKCKTLGDSREGVVKLLDGKRSIDCSINTQSVQEITFETPVQIEVTYFYRNSISKDITVFAGE